MKIKIEFEGTAEEFKSIFCNKVTAEVNNTSVVPVVENTPVVNESESTDTKPKGNGFVDISEI
jgi:hypothetical protein